MADNNGRDLERLVKIAAPYDSEVQAEVLVESLPVWFDLGWQKVDGENYGTYSDLEPAAADTSPSVELARDSQQQQKVVAPNPGTPQANPRTVVSTPGTQNPTQP